jgi:endonuclease V-like protein UPF0215 family
LLFGLEKLEDRRLLAGSGITPGVSLSKYDLTVSEGGTSEAFDVALTAQPSTDVVLNVSSSNPAEAAVWPVRLTFTPDNWDLPQPVLVTAVDDNVVDGPQVTAVTVSVDQEASDSSFASVSDQLVYVTTEDDDIAGFILSEAALTVSESGTTATFTAMLTARPNTYVTLVALSGNEAEAMVSPTVLTFAPSEWDQPQTVTVTGVDDPRIDGDQTTLVTVGVAVISDGYFRELADQTVSVITEDDDMAGFVLSKTLTLVSESGTTDTFTVVLTAQPETQVTLTVSGSDSSEATVSPAVLVFSPASWNLPQAVTVVGVDDFERDGAQETVVTVAVDAAQSDENFAGVAAQTVSVTTTDNDYGWQNLDNPFDVDGDGFVTANDVLILINHVNGNSGNSTLPSPPVSPPPYYDVNNDSRCTALDILLVINSINTQTAAASSAGGEGEGEAEGESVSPDASSAAAALPLEPRRIAVVQPLSVSTERLSDPIAAGPSRLMPIPLAATSAQRPFISFKPGRATQRIPQDWAAAVDAALEIWEPEWDAAAGLSSAA